MNLHHDMRVARVLILAACALAVSAPVAHAQRGGHGGSGGGGHGGSGGGLAPSGIAPGPGQTIIWRGPTSSGWVQGPYRGPLVGV
jgi:hypothetical protein